MQKFCSLKSFGLTFTYHTAPSWSENLVSGSSSDTRPSDKAQPAKGCDDIGNWSIATIKLWERSGFLGTVLSRACGQDRFILVPFFRASVKKTSPFPDARCINFDKFEIDAFLRQVAGRVHRELYPCSPLGVAVCSQRCQKGRCKKIELQNRHECKDWNASLTFRHSAAISSCRKLALKQLSGGKSWNMTKVFRRGAATSTCKSSSWSTSQATRHSEAISICKHGNCHSPTLQPRNVHEAGGSAAISVGETDGRRKLASKVQNECETRNTPNTISYRAVTCACKGCNCKKPAGNCKNSVLARVQKLERIKCFQKQFSHQ